MYVVMPRTGGNLYSFLCDLCSPVNVAFPGVHGVPRCTWCSPVSVCDTSRASPLGTYGLSNSLLDSPWMKVEHGKRLFTSVLEQHSLPSSQTSLVKGLLGVLNNDEL